MKCDNNGRFDVMLRSIPNKKFNGPIPAYFPHDTIQKYINKSTDGVLGLEHREAGWKAQTNPQSYGIPINFTTKIFRDHWIKFLQMICVSQNSRNNHFPDLNEKNILVGKLTKLIAVFHNEWGKHQFRYQA